MRNGILAAVTALTCLAQDPPSSWNEGGAKTAILGFAARTTHEAGADFVAVAERIATVDKDGTLWVEQAHLHAIRIRPRPFCGLWLRARSGRSSAALSGDLDGLATGENGVMEVMVATHAGTTTDAFEKVVKDWIGSSVKDAASTTGRPARTQATARGELRGRQGWQTGGDTGRAMTTSATCYPMRASRLIRIPWNTVLRPHPTRDDPRIQGGKLGASVHRSQASHPIDRSLQILVRGFAWTSV